MAAITYLYEFRDNNTVIATGRLTRDSALEVGDLIIINRQTGIVQAVVSTLDPTEQRLILERRSETDEPSQR